MAGVACVLMHEEYLHLARAVFGLADSDRGPLVAVAELEERLPTADGGPWLTTREFADRAGISIEAVGSYVAEGTLQAIGVTHKNRRRLLIPESELAKTPPRILEPRSGWITPREFALRAGVRHEYILGLIQKDRLPAVRRLAHSRRGHWVIDERRLETLVVRRRRQNHLTLLPPSPSMRQSAEDERTPAAAETRRAA